MNCISGTFPAIPNSSPLPILSTDISLGIYPKSDIAAIFINTEKNIASTTLAKDANDPVNLTTGDFTYSNTLMHLVGDGIDYNLDISYRSQVEYNGILGYNWDHSYNKQLIKNTDGSVTYSDGKIAKYTFVQSGSEYLPMK